MTKSLDDGVTTRENGSQTMKRKGTKSLKRVVGCKATKKNIFVLAKINVFVGMELQLINNNWQWDDDGKVDDEKWKNVINDAYANWKWKKAKIYLRPENRKKSQNREFLNAYENINTKNTQATCDTWIDMCSRGQDSRVHRRAQLKHANILKMAKWHFSKVKTNGKCK